VNRDSNNYFESPEVYRRVEFDRREREANLKNRASK
jgi:hypothetical protein